MLYEMKDEVAERIVKVEADSLEEAEKKFDRYLVSEYGDMDAPADDED